MLMKVTLHWYPSPMHDFGFDVSGYCDIDARFGMLLSK